MKKAQISVPLVGTEPATPCVQIHNLPFLNCKKGNLFTAFES